MALLQQPHTVPLCIGRAFRALCLNASFITECPWLDGFDNQMLMGRGDKRTKRGKIFAGSWGKARPKDRRPPWRREQERAMGAGQPLSIPPPTSSRAAFPVYVEFDDRPENEGSVDDAELPTDTHTPDEQATDPQQTVDSEQSSQQSS